MSTQRIDPPWGFYRRKGLAEMRPWTPEDGDRIALTQAGISVPEGDEPEEGGMIARDPQDHIDQWYVSKKDFKEKFEDVS